MADEKKELWTYEKFEPGEVFGTIDVHMDDKKRADWQRVFGSAGENLPRGMMVTTMMEAYIRAIQPRPDGNVHSSQELAFTGSPARWGDTVQVTVSLDDKEIRKDRFWVRFGIVAKIKTETVMTGTIRSIWAA